MSEDKLNLDYLKSYKKKLLLNLHADKNQGDSEFEKRIKHRMLNQ